MLSSPAGEKAAATTVELAIRELAVEQHAETADVKTEIAKAVQHAKAVNARTVSAIVECVRAELVLTVDVQMVQSVVSQCRSIRSIETFTRTMLLKV